MYRDNYTGKTFVTFEDAINAVHETYTDLDLYSWAAETHLSFRRLFQKMTLAADCTCQQLIETLYDEATTYYINNYIEEIVEE